MGVEPFKFISISVFQKQWQYSKSPPWLIITNANWHDGLLILGRFWVGIKREFLWWKIEKLAFSFGKHLSYSWGLHSR
jgi:hypothetical protein